MRICYFISALIVVIWRQERATGTALKISHTIDSQPETRNKRSLIIKAGRKAISEVFEVAKRIYSNGYDDVFLRKGGLEQAEKDFTRIMSANPSAIKEKKAKTPTILKKTGRIGQRIWISLEQRKTADPVLTVTSCETQCVRYNQKPIRKTIVYTD